MDPALLLALEVSPPPARPQIVEERQLLSEDAEKTKRYVDRTLRSYTEEIERWAERLRLHRIQSEVIPVQALSEGEQRVLDDLISDLESAAERRAVNLARSIKRARRDIKRAFEADPSLGAVLRDAEKRLHDIEERVIDDILEHALFVRALKAERNPNARGAQAFADPQELARFLERQRIE